MVYRQNASKSRNWCSRSWCPWPRDWEWRSYQTAHWPWDADIVHVGWRSFWTVISVARMKMCHLALVVTDAICVWRDTETRSRNHCCRGKAVNIIYTKCVSVALVILHLCPFFSAPCYVVIVACLDVPYFSTLSSTLQEFRGEIVEGKMF